MRRKEAVRQRELVIQRAEVLDTPGSGLELLPSEGESRPPVVAAGAPGQPLAGAGVHPPLCGRSVGIASHGTG